MKVSEYIETNEVQKMFDSAECFYKASELIESETKRAPTTGLTEGLHNASIVNHALSIELYLKCLQVITEGRFKTGHSLLELFDSLNVVIKDRIINQFNDSHTYGRYSVVITVRKKQFNLIEILTLAKNAFIEFRYSFENTTVDYIYELEQLTNTLRGIIMESAPDIKVDDTCWIL